MKGEGRGEERKRENGAENNEKKTENIQRKIIFCEKIMQIGNQIQKSWKKTRETYHQKQTKRGVSVVLEGK